MKHTQRTFAGALGLIAVAALGLSACSMDSDTPESSSAPAPEASSSEMATESSQAADSSMDPTANLVGSGCSAYAEAVPSGDGSVAGMAQDPVAVAASNNPLLKTLTKAVSGKLNPDVDLVDTLNGAEFTVFAPVDEAFAAIPEKDLNAVVKDSDMLTKVLTYHVVPGEIQSADIAGTHTTVEGRDLEVTGSADNLMVNDAKVVCGGVQTANAVVYLVDTVLMPPADK